MSFNNPLFIVGMPRSGTKLLRDLMNQNPLVSIPDVETNFIPFLVNKFGIKLSLSTVEEKREFYKEFSKTTFYFSSVRKGRLIGMEEFITGCDFTSWTTVFRYIAISYSKKNFGHNVVWGDKTPGYLKVLPLLKEIFPGARFIHIIRDPRDYCVSVRKIWNKNIYRAAFRWFKIMKQAQKYDHLFGKDYLKVSYEDLTSDAQPVLTSICSFLGIDFTDEMLSVKKSHEFYGDAKGSTKIISNSGKFSRELSDAEIKKIEQLTVPVISEYGYVPVHRVNHESLTSYEDMFYRIQDILMTYRFHIKDKGLVKGTVYTLKLRNNNLESAGE